MRALFILPLAIYSVSTVLFTRTLPFTLGDAPAIHTSLLPEISNKMTIIYTPSIYEIEPGR